VKPRHDALLLLGVLLIAASMSNAANVEHHMYWGVAAKDQIWAEFDPGFADSLFFGWPTYDTMKLLADKFYLIGLTLPDAMLADRQTAIREAISALYSVQDAIDDRATLLKILLIHIPFWITGQTYTQVQTPITFNGPEPNDNFQKMWEMACYARDQGWPYYEKSLIYGALAHCMQDAYGTVACIPSRFGHNFALDAPESREYEVLRYGETYSELLTGTHIPNWGFISHLFGAVFRGGPNQVIYKHEGLQFYSTTDFYGANYRGWQDLNFPPTQRFVDAATATGYATASLTQERLESYLHGTARDTSRISERCQDAA